MGSIGREKTQGAHGTVSAERWPHVRILTGFVKPCSRAMAKVEVTDRDRQWGPM